MNANRVKPNVNGRPKLFRRVDLLRSAVPNPLRTFPIALAIIVASVLLNFVYLVWFCPLDLSPDEAHYWDWSRRLDWSYYSKGPLIAWIILLVWHWFGRGKPMRVTPLLRFIRR